ncbi:PREDICTED: coiled-coil domain-containing protein 180 [Nanorana parkeri]|uniref:coiled-coil domain-containing protein 180 n=1 Tax=Nanorana parkeri TaxID=125878 RepID=UPI000854754E|nr:PREDICTED: coiled-coil domain-containing protein 180 [Nanorana parkeri]
MPGQMALVGEVHVVPSGKVYRQIFDAEVQLVRSLGEARARVAQHGVSLDSAKIPLVRDETHSSGLLSHRQREWVDSMPYDSYSENPVVYREKTTSTLRKVHESEDEIAAREVRGLCDVIVSEKRDSNILQRITTNRQERHEKAVSTLHEELAGISKEMEVLVLEAGINLQGYMSESDRKIDLLFQQCEKRRDNRSFTMVFLNEFWGHVVEDTSYRKEWIRLTENTLFDIEEKRADRIADVLKKFTTLLTEICYLMPSDVLRFIHEEAMMINQAILANHRAIAKLSLNLKEAELKRERAQWLQWQDLIKAWKSHEKESVVTEFRLFAEKEMDQMPGSVKKEIDLLIDQQQLLHTRRLQLLCSVSDFIPETCTKAAVNEWHKSLVALNKEMVSVNTQFLDRLHNLQSDATQRCTTAAETCQAQLMNLEICSKEEAKTIMTKELSPLTEQFQINYDKEQRLFSDPMMTVSKQIDSHTNKLFKYAKKAVHLWDVLQIGLSQQEKALQRNLDHYRKKYETENQKREANLDIILDSLRQGSTEEQLRALMGKSLACLQDIKAGYLKCHHDQVIVIKSYPKMVLSKLMSYSSSVSKFFCVQEVYGENVPPKIEESDGKGYRTMPQEPEGSDVEEKPIVNPGYASQDIDDKTGVTWDHPIEGTGVNTPQPPEIESTGADEGNTGQVTAQVSTENKDNETHSSGHHDVLETPVSAQNELSPAGENTEAPEIVGSFVTFRGNTYTVLSSSKKQKNTSVVIDQPVTDNVFFTEAVIEEESPANIKQMLVPEELITELKNNIRLGFFEHLECWFTEMVSNSHCIVLAKKEELKSELDLLCHLHEPRGLRIEMDIHNVRAAELLLHSERVDRHCEGVNQALNDLKEESALLIEKMKRETENFRSKIMSMQSTFLNANKSDKLVALINSLSTILDSHNSGVQTAMRNYRQHVEEMLGKLCDTNSDFIKSFKLFSEGGNFSPEEIETLRKRLHKASATIASFEGSIMVDLEGLESLCLEQATEVVKKFEDKFQSLTMDTIFLENIQKSLTNLQVKIKALVVTSNCQSQQINTYLEQLRMKTDACASPNMDKQVVTSQELYDFAKLIMEEVSRRSRYLSCLLEPSPILPEVPLQGPIAAAARVDAPLRQDGKVVFGTHDSLLNPSRIGKLALDDAALGVIKNIMKAQRTNGESQQKHNDGNRLSSFAVSRQGQPLAPRPPSRPTSGSITKKKSGTGDGENTKFASPSVRKLVKPTRFDKKYQVFGEKKEESNHFKGILMSILWESNNNLLYLAEEFYKKKDRRPVGRPDLLQETFEDCADMLVLKLQTYEKQALEYHNNCLLEFREQLEEFEKLLRDVPELVIESLRREHLQAIQMNIDQIQQLFGKELGEWNQTKEEIKNLLRPSLGHPDNWQTLVEICQREEKRQQEETEGIECTAKQLQDCVLESMQRFVTSLASLTESILLQLDEVLTVDDVLPAKMEIPKEKLLTLIRRKKAGLPLKDTEYQPLIERGSRVWPGITLKNSADITDGTSTASVTTAKTTLSHVSTVEARDSAYLKSLQDTKLALTSIVEEQKQQQLAAQRWKQWWNQSILKIKELYL